LSRQGEDVARWVAVHEKMAPEVTAGRRMWKWTPWVVTRRGKETVPFVNEIRQ
jgi:hypothetical protein